MAYTTEELEKMALEAIKENDLYFNSDIAAFLPCCEKTLYNHELQELQVIKDALNENRVKSKTKMRKKWKDSDNASLQIGLYKLIANDEERKRLATNYNEHTGKDGQPLPAPVIVRYDPTKQEAG